MRVAADEAHMRRAITLAAAHVGLTGENPSVGCVLVRGGTVVGEGVTGRGGRPHAEEAALAAAGGAAQGATAYVTLEPCGERSSGQPSCAALLAAAGVARVVVACVDRSAFAAGRGPERLRAAGVAVEVGMLADEAQALYANYRPRDAASPPA